MVFFFTLISDPNATVFCGDNSAENDQLIRWGFPLEDIWFHVDSHSSAHYYLRFPTGSIRSREDLVKAMDAIKPEVLEEICQLNKANSISGSKESCVKIVFTPWFNLKKTGDMDEGSVGFHDERLRRFYTVEKKNNDIIKHHEKTKVHKEQVDFRTEREQRDAETNRLDRMAEKQRKEEEKRLEEERKKLAEQRSYASLMTEENMKKNNNNAAPPDEDDFM